MRKYAITTALILLSSFCRADPYGYNKVVTLKVETENRICHSLALLLNKKTPNEWKSNYLLALTFRALNQKEDSKKCYAKAISLGGPKERLLEEMLEL